MSVRLMIEVMDDAPDSLTFRERYVLMALAETASDDTRLCWPAYDGDDERSKRFRRRARCSRSQFYETLRSLIEKGAVRVEVPGHYRAQAVYSIPRLAGATPMPPKPRRKRAPKEEPGAESVPESGTQGSGSDLCPENRDTTDGGLCPENQDTSAGVVSRFTESCVPESGTPTPQYPSKLNTLNSLSPEPAQDPQPGADSRPAEERENTQSDQDGIDPIAFAHEVLEAFTSAASRPAAASVRRRITDDARALLAIDGEDPDLILRAARTMPGRGWTDLVRAVEWVAAQDAAAGTTPTPGAPTTGHQLPPCGLCDHADRMWHHSGRDSYPCPVCNPLAFAGHLRHWGDPRDEYTQSDDEKDHRYWTWLHTGQKGPRPQPSDRLYQHQAKAGWRGALSGPAAVNGYATT